MRGERKLYLDIVKVAGSLAIVMLHVNSSTWHDAYASIPILQETVIHLLHQFLYIAVPVFMMATGAGFLKKTSTVSYPKMCPYILKITGCIIVFGSLFWMLEAVYLHSSPWNPREMLLAVLADSTWSHMWYLYRVLGVYLCLPPLSAFMKQAGMREQILLCGILFFFQCLYPFAAGIIGFIPPMVLPVQGMWIFYALVGGIIGELTVDRLKKITPLALSGMILSCLAITVYCVQVRDAFFMEDHPFAALYAVSLFALIKLVCNDRKTSPRLLKLSKCTLGIYIIHPIFIHVVTKIIGWNPQLHLPGISLPVTAICIWGLSFICVSFGSHLLFRNCKEIS